MSKPAAPRRVGDKEALAVGTTIRGSAQATRAILLEKTEKDLEHSFTRIFALGLGLLFLGQ